MSYTKVRNYTDNELLKRVKSLSNFKVIPKDYWILGVRSKADTPNVYDDKFYLFKGEKFIMVTTGTTNPGTEALGKGWRKVNKDGAFVLKSDYWHYNLWQPGKHNGKIRALTQTGNVAVGYRDNNDNNKSEEIGVIRSGWYGINFHCNSYTRFQRIISWLIGGWSYGCQVCNNLTDYYRILDLIGKQSKVSYCLLSEF